MKLILMSLLLTISFSASAENVIVKFYTTWCPPCQKMKPLVASISEKLNIQVRGVDMDTQSGGALAERLGIDRIPTLLLIKDGKEVCRIIGALKEDVLLKRVQDCFNTPSPVSDGSKSKSPVNTSKTQVGNRETPSPTAGSSN
jgi:thioredoxin 1